MELINESSSPYTLEKNTIAGNPSLINSTIKFTGSGNTLFCEEGVVLQNTNINFNGNDSFVYLSKSNGKFILNFNIMDNSIIYIGRNNYFNGKLSAVISEEKNLFIGDESLFSFGIFIRTSDAHSVYDCSSKKRINRGGNIIIGDHTWIGQDVFIAKNTIIGSGSIIGTKSVLSGKKIESNTIYAGNPAKKIKDGVFFTGNSAHRYFPQNDIHESDMYVYEKSEFLGIDEVIDFYSKQRTNQEKITFFSTLKKEKNRFYIENKIQPKKRLFPFNILKKG